MVAEALSVKGRPIKNPFDHFLLGHNGQTEWIEFEEVSCACGARGARFLLAEPIAKKRGEHASR
jgi:hypothetical protein